MLQIFEPKTFQPTNHKRMRVFFTVVRGHVTFNHAAVSRLNLSPGDQIKFAKNPETNRWFFCKVETDGWPLKTRNAKAPQLYFSCPPLVKKIFESEGFIGGHGHANIDPVSRTIDDVVYWHLNDVDNATEKKSNSSTLNLFEHVGNY